MDNKKMKLGKGGYLCRCSIWDWHDNSTIKIIDENGNYIARLDEWQTLVFFMADGSNDIEEIVDLYIDRRGELTECDFRHQILASGSTLVDNLHVVELSEQKKDIKYSYKVPLKEQRDDGVSK